MATYLYGVGVEPQASNFSKPQTLRFRCTYLGNERDTDLRWLNAPDPYHHPPRACRLVLPKKVTKKVPKDLTGWLNKRHGASRPDNLFV